jgi:hypothetical protein
MWEDFHEAIAHTEHRLLGRKLKPFCPWYRLWLEITKSPLVTGGTVSHVDMEIAARICSSTFADTPHVLKRDGVIRRKLRQASMLWKLFRHPLDAQLKAWEEYVRDFCPKIQNEGRDVKFEDLPSDLVVVSSYRRLTGCSKEEAWMTPVGELRWWIGGMRYAAGEPSGILSEQERTILERCNIPSREAILRARMEREQANPKQPKKPKKPRRPGDNRT